MARLNKISNSHFDTNKPVIVCGKGPSIDKLGVFVQDHHADDFYFCAVNTAYKMMPRTDFLSFCDLGVLEELDSHPDDYLKIKNFICPIVLREAIGQGVYESDKTFQFLLDKTKDLDANVYTYKLFTQNRHVDIDKSSQDDFYMSSLMSSYHCALNWLTQAGFRKFEIFGVSQQREYHQSYIDNNDCGNNRGNDFYERNFQQGVDIMNKHKCWYQHH